MALPIVTSVSPSSGPTAGGTAITIAGSHFTGTTDVLFDGTSASFAVVDDNTISATTPGSPFPGPQLVEVVNADGSSEDTTPVTMFDSSGNGNDAPYDPDDLGTVEVQVPGLVTGNDAASVGGGGGVNRLGGNAPVSPSLGTGDVFVCGWMQSDSVPGTFEGPTPVGLSGSISGGGFRVQMIVGFFSPTADFQVVRETDAGVDFVSVAALDLDTAPHFIAATYEAATETYTAYLDGVQIGTASTTVPGSTGLALDHVDTIGGGSQSLWIFDEIAFGSTLLSAGDVSDLYDARGDFSTYDALMLSFSPTGYYHLDETHGVSGIFTYKAANGWHVGRVGVGV